MEMGFGNGHGKKGLIGRGPAVGSICCSSSCILQLLAEGKSDDVTGQVARAGGSKRQKLLQIVQLVLG